jgi:hypothetical protein
MSPPASRQCPPSPCASSSAARRGSKKLGALALVAIVAWFGGCTPSSRLATPRGLSWSLEDARHPFEAARVLDAAHLSSRSPHAALFEGPPGHTLAAGTDAPLVFLGLPRGDGYARTDDGAFVREASLVIADAVVDELRSRGVDARLDRTSSLALVGREHPTATRVLWHLDIVHIRRTSTAVDASTSLSAWTRTSTGEPRWEQTFALSCHVTTPPFDVLGCLAAEAARELAKRLLPASPAAPPLRDGAPPSLSPSLPPGTKP